ncbi:hypothetical protein FOCC_FOCC011966, partial [Frankliniella occidentalis]
METDPLVIRRHAQRQLRVDKQLQLVAAARADVELRRRRFELHRRVLEASLSAVEREAEYWKRQEELSKLARSRDQADALPEVQEGAEDAEAAGWDQPHWDPLALADSERRLAALVLRESLHVKAIADLGQQLAILQDPIARLSWRDRVQTKEREMGALTKLHENCPSRDMGDVKTNDFLTSTSDRSVFVIDNSESWDIEDAQDIAKRIVDEIESFPITLITEDLDGSKYRNYVYDDHIVTQRLKACALPAVRVLTTSAEIETYEVANCKIVIELVRSFIKQSLKVQSVDDVVKIVASLFIKVAKYINSVKAERKERAKREREKAKKAAELREQKLKEELAKLKLKLKEKMTDDLIKNLPPSLQPTIRPFDPDNILGWFEHFHFVYKAHGIPEDKLVPLVGQFLPPQWQGLHNSNKEKNFGDYCKRFMAVVEPNRTGQITRLKLSKMSKRPTETVQGFIYRVHDFAKTDPSISEQEVIQILLGILPAEDARLVACTDCETVDDLVERLSSYKQNMEIIGSKNSSGNVEDLITRKFEELKESLGPAKEAKKTASAAGENKILATVEVQEIKDKMAELQASIDQLNLGGSQAQAQAPAGNGLVIAKYIYNKWDKKFYSFIEGNREEYYRLHSGTHEMAAEPQIQAAADALSIGIRIKRDNNEYTFKCKGPTEIYVAMRHTGEFDRGHFDPLIPRQIFDVLSSSSNDDESNNKESNGEMNFNAKGTCKVAVVEPKGSDLAEGTRDQARHRGTPSPDRMDSDFQWKSLRRTDRNGTLEKSRSRNEIGVFSAQQTGSVVGTSTHRSDSAVQVHPLVSSTRLPGEGSVADRRLSGVECQVRSGSSVRWPDRAHVVCTYEAMTGDVMLCSCCYEPDDLEEITKINWENPIELAPTNSTFPIKIKINGRKLVAFIDEHAECSVIAPLPWLEDERVQIMRGEVKYLDQIRPITGIFNPKIEISNKVKTCIPMVVANLPESVGVVLGKNLLCKLQSSYAEGNDTYSFKIDGFMTAKGRAKPPAEDEWEVLKLSEDNVDDLQLTAVLDLGAVRSVLNTKYCTDKNKLEPIKIKLRTANDSFLPVHGLYRPVIKINDCEIQHPLVCAALPNDIDLLIGNDFLEKYKANISWENERITLKIKGKVIEAKRIRGVHEGGVAQSTPTSEVNCLTSNSQGNIILKSTKEIIIEPNQCALVHGEFDKDVLPAIFYPCVVDGNVDVSSMECFLLEDTTVPVFNCSRKRIIIPPGADIGYVTPENQKIESSRLTTATLAEITYAVENKLLTLDGQTNVPTVDCNALPGEEMELIPSLDGADITESEKELVRELCRKFPTVFSKEMKAGAPVPNFFTHLERTHEVTEQSKLLLGFTFEGRSLRWTRLPQGLAVSPPESLIALSRIMRGVDIRYYVDDLIVGAQNFDSLLHLLEQVLVRLRDNNLYLKNFAVRMQKYHDMTNEKIPFEWTENDAKDIENMYNYLLENATLALFDEKLPCKLHCDASSTSIGAMLTSKQGERERNKVPDALSRLEPTTELTAEVSIPNRLITKLNDGSFESENENENVDLDEKKALVNVETNKMLVPYSPDGNVADLYHMSSVLDNTAITSFRAEHAYQAAKTFDIREKIRIRNAESPKEAKLIGKSLKRLRSDWDDIRVKIMLDVLCSKFEAGTDIELQLLETGDRELIEGNNWHDNFWGSNCNELNPSGDDRKNMVLAITRSKAKNGLESSKFAEIQAAQQLDAVESNQNKEQCTAVAPDLGAVGHGSSGGSDAPSVTSEPQCTANSGVPAVTSADRPTGDPMQGPGQLSASARAFGDEGEEIEINWKDDDFLNSEKVIKNFSDDYYFLSVHSPSKFVLDGKEYLSVEDALNTNQILFPEDDLTYVPNQSKHNPMLRKIRVKMDNAARDVALEFLVKCLQAKFAENKELKDKLLETEGYSLVYVNKACKNCLGVCLCTKCLDNVGYKPRNLLGIELMRLRAIYRREKELEQIANAMNFAPTLSRFIEFQRGDPELAKIIATFTPEGKPTERTEKYRGKFKFALKKNLLVTNTKIPRSVLPKSLIPVQSTIQMVPNNLSNLTHLYPCVKADQDALKEGLETFFSLHGRPRILMMDAGPQSKSTEFLAWVQRNGIALQISPSNAHWSSGRVESQIKRLVSTLRFLLDNKPSRLRIWHKYIRLIQFHLNNCPQVATGGLSSNEIIFGRLLDTPLSLKTTLPRYTTINRRIDTLAKIREEVVKSRQKAFSRYSKYYNKGRKSVKFQRNDQVYVQFQNKASLTYPLKFQRKFRR